MHGFITTTMGCSTHIQEIEHWRDARGNSKAEKEDQPSTAPKQQLSCSSEHKEIIR